MDRRPGEETEVSSMVIIIVIAFAIGFVTALCAVALFTRIETGNEHQHIHPHGGGYTPRKMEGTPIPPQGGTGSVRPRIIEYNALPSEVRKDHETFCNTMRHGFSSGGG